jgi:hypothetical protein
MVDMRELGSTGLSRNGGQMNEEWLRELSGERGRRVYREMADMDPVIGASLFAIQMLMAQVDHDVEPDDATSQDDTAAATFIAEALDDMSSSWEDMLSDILSMMVYGWAYFEVVYKVRRGDSRDPKRRSKYDDGRIGWRKWSIRGQDSFDEWAIDAEGGIQGMYQRDSSAGYSRVFIPIDKALLFRTSNHKNNPEGKSALRSAYRPWWFKKNIENIEGIGIERDLAGLPVAYVPPDILASDADVNSRAVLSAIKDIVVNIRRDEQEGVVFPLAYDEDGHQLYKLELLSTGGQRQFDTDKIISRYDSRIAMTMMADFILLGHEGVGSYALGADKSSLFRTALTTWLDKIAGVINAHAIPRLLRLNGLRGRCHLAFGQVGTIDLAALGEFIGKVAGAGMPLFPDSDLENHIRTKANMPLLSDEEIERREDEPVAPPPTPPAQSEPDDDVEDDEMAAILVAAARVLSRGEG